MEPFELKPKRRAWVERAQALLEVILLGGVVSSYVAIVPLQLLGAEERRFLKDARWITGFVLIEAAVALMLVLALLHLHREKLRDLGLHAAGWRKNVAIGLALVPCLFLINGSVALLIRRFFPAFYMERNPLIDTIRTPRDLALFLFAVLFAGGLKEEIQRAFILTRFRDHLGGASVGLVVWSLAFGAQHYVQGVQGAVAAALFGLVFGIVYLVRNSLLAPIVAHGIYDATALLGYWFLEGSRRQ